MKNIQILMLILTWILLTGCFQKPVSDDNSTPPVEDTPIVEEQEAPEDPVDESQQGNNDDQQEEDTPQEDSNEEEENEPTVTWSVNEQEIIEEYEEELEELFNDILGGDE